MTGEPGRPGVRVGSSLIDQGTGTWAALGVLAALLERDRTGEGSVVDVSLYETALGYIGYHLAGYLADGTVPARTGHAIPDGGAVPGVPHARRRADDRRRQRPAVRRDLRRGRRYPSSSTTRGSARTATASRNRESCATMLAVRLAQDDTALAGGSRTRASPRRPSPTSPTSLDAPQTEALGMLQPLPHPDDTRTSGSTALPLSFDGERAMHHSPPPTDRSAHGGDLRDAGYDDDEIAALAAEGSNQDMSHLSASFSATIRVRLTDAPGSFARLAQAIGEAGGSLGAIDLVRVEHQTKVRDVTVDAADADHLDRIVEHVRAVEGVEVERVSDRTFLMHLGGKIEMSSKVPVKTRDDLSMAYTPGVARICQAIAADPESAWNLTIKQNTVAVVSDGTAVLGLGDIGPRAAMPVMEGKALLFKEFGGVDAWPICLDTTDTDEIVSAVRAIAPGFGGINLEDISAPRCFEIEERLRAELDIPVFHDDQHGTAIVVLAALLNALAVVGKRIEDVKSRDHRRGRGGRGGHEHPPQRGCRARHRLRPSGRVHRGRDGMNAVKSAYAGRTNPREERGSPDDMLAGADVYLGLSVPGAVSRAGIEAMADDAIVFAMANPTPEIAPEELPPAKVAVVATGRSDYPNQINNVLAFPGVFRGALDVARRSDH